VLNSDDCIIQIVQQRSHDCQAITLFLSSLPLTSWPTSYSLLSWHPNAKCTSMRTLSFS
jgi:hypothetical protein